MAEYPLVPRRLPDGTQVWEEKGKARDVMEALRHYDARLSLCRDIPRGAWEVRRQNEDGSVGRVWGPLFRDLLPEPNVIVAEIWMGDQAHGYDPIADIEAREIARQRDSDYRFDQATGEASERLRYEMIDELSPHMPAALPISTAPNRHRKIRTKEARERGLIPGGER